MPKQKLSNLYITKDGIKIGVIGLTTIETPQTTDAFQKHKFPNFTFEKYSSIVI
jgi:2',3'-cyclic-nucleotide 2'-phosphodiesterase (5'-nucleotidase family)